MSYNVEMVKQFAQANKSDIDKITLENPALGNLLKQALDSMAGEIVTGKTIDFKYADDTKPPNAGIDSVGITWIPLEGMNELKSSLKFSEETTFRKRAELVRQLININLNVPHKELLLNDALKTLLFLGNFYEIYPSKQNISAYERIKSKKIDLEKKLVEYELITEYQDVFDFRAADVAYDTRVDNMVDVAETLITKMFKFEEMLDWSKKLIEEKAIDTMIYLFLKAEGYLGFFKFSEGYGKSIPMGWYETIEIDLDKVALQDVNDKIYTIEFKNLGLEVGTDLTAIEKPKFKEGEIVKVLNDPELLVSTGEVLAIELWEVKKQYYYNVKAGNLNKKYLESDLEKAEPQVAPITPQTPKTITPKKTVNPTPSPAEIEFSNMTQEQLKTEKEGIEEALSYMNDDDDEKNDLEIQLELVNLYLKN
jgi:hypothetical protein